MSDIEGMRDIPPNSGDQTAADPRRGWSRAWRLYDLTGRDTEWARIFSDIEGDYTEQATDGPLPGRDDDCSTMTEYRVRITRDRRE
jgi:hypothetical protein